MTLKSVRQCTAASPANPTQRRWSPAAGPPPRRRQARPVAAAVAPSGRVILYDLYDHQVPYEQAWQWQKRLVDLVHELTAGDNTPSSRSGGESDVVGAALLLQHPPVYTLGAGATEGHLKFDPAAPPLPLYRTERGGEVTYHGPGQLVLYPIISLRAPGCQPDLHWYLRSLEEVVMRALDEVSGLQGGRVPGLTGVWVNGQKVAAIGVRATRWVTYHGLALNVTTDLAPFRDIVPCGISDRPVASVAGLLAQQEGQPAQLSEAAATAAEEAQLLLEYRHGLVAALEEVFGVDTEALEGAEAVAQLNSLLEGTETGGASEAVQATAAV